MKKTFLVNMLVKSQALILGFAISIVLSRAFGSETLGMFVLYIAFYNLFLIPTKCGQDKYLLKELSAKPENIEKNSEILVNASAIVLLFSTIVMSLVAVCILLGFYQLPINSTEYSSVIFALYLSLLGGGSTAILVSLLRAENRLMMANLWESLPLNLMLLIALLVSWLLFDIKEFSTGVVVCHGVISILIACCIVANKKNMLSAIKLSKLSVPSEQIKVGGSFALIAGVSAINASIDTFSIGYFMTVSDVAFYNVAQKLSSLISFSLAIGVGMVSNRFACLFRDNDRQALKTVLRNVTKIVSLVGLLTFIVLMLFQRLMLGIWGDEYISASAALVILSIAQLINVFFGPIGVLLNMSGMEKKVLFIAIFSMLVNVLLNIALVPVMGMEGAALATGSSIIIQNVMFYILLRLSRILVD